MTNPDQRRPFDAVRLTLQDISPEDQTIVLPPAIKLEPNRHERSGIPEVIYAATKTPADVWAASYALAAASGRAIASRCRPECAGFLVTRAEETRGEFSVEHDEVSGVTVTVFRGAAIRATGGRVGVIAAGTSDTPFAFEAATMAREMGCAVETVSDVGVAGLHRLVRPLEALMADGADVLIVAAGMDGALPSVVAGLVNVPVIGLPTSTGYGFGGQGIGALTTMLQSCAPGLAVVNIDNGIGAGSTAALIANRVAAARQRSHRDDAPDR